MRSTCQRSYTQPGALPICRSIQVFEEVFSSCAQGQCARGPEPADSPAGI